MLSPTASLFYAQATATQRTQVLQYLQTRLRRHFPTLPAQAFARALAELRPPLLVTGSYVALPYLDLTHLVQYLSDTPALLLLDPPLFGPWALELAQHSLHTSELTAGVLVALAAKPRTGCPPPLWTLLQRLATPYPLAERIVQARRWDLPSSPPLPAGQPGGGPAPGSPAVAYLLQLLAPDR